MSYEKFVMYLSTIPETEDDETAEGKEAGESKSAPKETGTINLFDLDQR